MSCYRCGYKFIYGYRYFFYDISICCMCIQQNKCCHTENITEKMNVEKRIICNNIVDKKLNNEWQYFDADFFYCSDHIQKLKALPNKCKCKLCNKFCQTCNFKYTSRLCWEVYKPRDHKCTTHICDTCFYCVFCKDSHKCTGCGQLVNEKLHECTKHRSDSKNEKYCKNCKSLHLVNIGKKDGYICKECLMTSVKFNHLKKVLKSVFEQKIGIYLDHFMDKDIKSLVRLYV
jgi:hypothetical protein